MSASASEQPPNEAPSEAHNELGGEHLKSVFRKRKRVEAELDITHYECGVCQELLVTPVTLLCGHNLCLMCLNRMQYDYDSYKEKSSIVCPTCKGDAKAHSSCYKVNQPLKEIVLGCFPEEAKLQKEEEISRVKDLAKYELYSKELFKMKELLMTRIRYRPVIAYNELLEYIEKTQKRKLGLNELLHLLSYLPVHLYKNFCIHYNCIFIDKNISDVLRYTWREWHAQKGGNLDGTLKETGTQMEVDDLFIRIKGEVSLAFDVQEFHNYIHPDDFLLDFVSQFSLESKRNHLRSFETVSEQISKTKLSSLQSKDCENGTEATLGNIVRRVYKQKHTRMNYDDDGSDWDDDDDTIGFLETVNEQYKYLNGWKYPKISENEIFIAKRRSATIANKKSNSTNNNNNATAGSSTTNTTTTSIPNPLIPSTPPTPPPPLRNVVRNNNIRAVNNNNNNSTTPNLNVVAQAIADIPCEILHHADGTISFSLARGVPNSWY